MPLGPLKKCPYCGETVLSVAIRCKHCQSDLTRSAGQPAGLQAVGESTGVPAAATTGADAAAQDFERRFLEFAYNSTVPLSPPAVAYALKCSIAQATDQLEDLAARDILQREVTDEGQVLFHLPGRDEHLRAKGVSGPLGSRALVPRMSTLPAEQVPPTEGQAIAALLLNTMLLPGLGSLVAGQTSAGIGQLMLCLIGLPLCFVAVGFPILFASWIWGLSTGIQLVAASRHSRNDRGDRLRG